MQCMYRAREWRDHARSMRSESSASFAPLSIVLQKTARNFDPDQTFARRTRWQPKPPNAYLCVAINSTLPRLRMSVAARIIIELNIKHYRELLERETDASKRETIAKLLAEEEDKLAKLQADESGTK
jgi:hypothetical protein